MDWYSILLPLSATVEESLIQGVSALGPSCLSRSALFTILSLLLDWSCQQLNNTEKGSVQELERTSTAIRRDVEYISW
jgi:hypothetical protein